MKEIKLTNELTLSFEALDKKGRLIISNTGKELACRKESLKNLQKFLASDEAHLFKGRLQLVKKATLVDVILKGENIGVISSNQFKEALNSYL